MNGRGRTAAASALLTLVAAFAIGASASAESDKDTKIIMNTDPPFYGTVESTSSHCVEERIVRAFKKTDGRDKFLGDTTTDVDGHWSIPLGRTLRPGVYYSKVRRLRVSEGQFCGGDRSNRIVVA